MKLRIPSAEGNVGTSVQSPALSSDGHTWFQLGAGGRLVAAPLAVVLTGADKADVEGLLDLRRGAPIQLYATPAVFEQLTQTLPLLPVLEHYCGVQWHLIPVAGDRRRAEFSISGCPTLSFTAMTLDATPCGERIALAVRDAATDFHLGVAPASSLLQTDWAGLHDADCLLLSGPLPSSGRRWLDELAKLPPPRKILLHAGAEDALQGALGACGIERASAGQEIEL